MTRYQARGAGSRTYNGALGEELKRWRNTQRFHRLSRAQPGSTEAMHCSASDGLDYVGT